MRKQAQEMVSTLAVKRAGRRVAGPASVRWSAQAVSICRAAGFTSKLIIMDEPTAALGVQETARVEELVLRLKSEGHAIVLISHNFAQVLRLSDAVWVMRAGRCVAGRRTADTNGDEIVALITGARAVTCPTPSTDAVPHPTVHRPTSRKPSP